jgi:cytochrome P450
MPPWNPIFGHLAFCNKLTSSLPKDAHPNYLPAMIRQELPDLGPVYYVDTWPFGPQMLIVASTDGLHQITQEHSLPKYPALKYFLRPIAEGLDLVTMEGDLWKTWRGIFNPAFSAHYIASLTEGIVEKTEVFCEILEDLSQGHHLFHMKKLTDNLTIDVIGRIVM